MEGFDKVEWLIIDDGSTGNGRGHIQSLILASLLLGKGIALSADS